MVPGRVLTAHDVLAQPGFIVVDGCYFYNYSEQSLTEDRLRSFTAGDTAGHTPSLVYSRYELPNGLFDIVVISPRSQITFLAALAILLLLVVVIVMLAGFFAYNRRLIQDIHHCLDEMAAAIENDFNPPEGPDGFPLPRLQKGGMKFPCWPGVSPIF